MDIIAELIVVCFSSEFKDENDFGLEWSLRKAIENLILLNPIEVKSMLNKILAEQSDNKRIITFCNLNLELVDKTVNISNDVPLSKKKAREYLKTIST